MSPIFTCSKCGWQSDRIGEKHHCPKENKTQSDQEAADYYVDVQLCGKSIDEQHIHEAFLAGVTHARKERDELMSEAVELLREFNCECTVQERLSGHRSFCNYPMIQEFLSKYEAQMKGEG